MGYFLTYLKQQKTTNHKNSSAILEEYGLHLAEAIKKGYKYEYLLGGIFIAKKDVLSKKPQILSGETKRLRERTGDNTLKVYRTNDTYWSIFWTLASVYRKLEVRFSDAHNRSLKNYNDYLELTAPAIELERTRLAIGRRRTSQYQIKR
jgi:hypothetical protein